MKNTLGYLTEAYVAVEKAEYENKLDDEDKKILETVKHLIEGIEKKIKLLKEGWY